MSDAESIDRGWGAAAEEETTLQASLWQVNTRGRKVVAMTDRELASNYKSGKLTARSLVWGDGMGEWTPLGDVPQLAKLLRDSEPPESGTRPRLDELTSGTEAYGMSSDVTTNSGAVAVYERPLALIEFPETIEPAEPADEPTPSFATPTATPSAKARVSAPLPARKTADAKPVAEAKSPASKPTQGARDSSADVTPEPATIRVKPTDAAAEETPRAPPLPPFRSVRETLPGPLFPSPVLDSPLAAALTAAAPPSTPAAPAVAARAKPPSSPTAAAPPPPPPLPVVRPVPASMAHAVSEPASLVKPPRPAIEFLPPIIVHEKEDDDGASAILELPLHGVPLDGGIELREAPFSESTLVLSGRKRARQWIPLNAVIALCVGAACFASALTAVFVRSRPAPAPRIVEKIVTVPAAPAKVAVVAPPVVEAARAPAPTAEPEPKAAAPAETTRAATTGERSAAKTEPPKSVASEASGPVRAKDSWRQDPGALSGGEEAKPRREARAGFPTNPGF